MKKKVFKKLTLNKESIVRLDPSALGEMVGGISMNCTDSAQCTISCLISNCGACSGRATCRC